MKFPKEVNAYCPHCRKHTLHTVDTAKKKTRRKLSQGQRRFLKKLKGYGSFPKEKPDFEKPTKRVDIRLKCKECGKKHSKKGWRIKKFELVKI